MTANGGRGALFDRLAQCERVALGHFPTPLEEVPRFSDGLGRKVFIKREDLSGLAAGGNKVRKLEMILATPAARAADVLITEGSPQSNHARETAAAAARLGKRCLLVLQGDDDLSTPQGNARLYPLFGAETVLVPGSEEVEPVIAERVAGLEAEGQTVFRVPMGGAAPEGVAAWALGMQEIAAELARRGERPADVVVGAGTASTAAGLALGAAALDWDVTVWGISVSRQRERLERDKVELIEAATALLDAEDLRERALELFRLEFGSLGPGYRTATQAGQAMFADFAARAGALADLTYTAKALAGLRQLIEQGRVGNEGSVVYVHTGGAPDIFARPLTELPAHS